jgi:hypothetical protein
LKNQFSRFETQYSAAIPELTENAK